MQELKHSRAKIRITLFAVRGLIRHLRYISTDDIPIKGVPRESSFYIFILQDRVKLIFFVHFYKLSRLVSL